MEKKPHVIEFENGQRRIIVKKNLVYTGRVSNTVKRNERRNIWVLFESFFFSFFYQPVRGESSKQTAFENRPKARVEPGTPGDRRKAARTAK
jgi:hypothetical protein